LWGIFTSPTTFMSLFDVLDFHMFISSDVIEI